MPRTTVADRLVRAALGLTLYAHGLVAQASFLCDFLCEERLHGLRNFGGVRIEDVVHVTATGIEQLTTGVFPHSFPGALSIGD